MGIIYKHLGPRMIHSQDGRGTTLNAKSVRAFTALKFIGNAMMTNDLLDNLCEIPFRGAITLEVCLIIYRHLKYDS